MKNGYLIIVLVLSLSFLLMPLLAVEDKTPGTSQVTSSEQGGSDSEKNEVKVYISSEQKTLTMDCTDYITGVVAGEMPAEYGEEALKAQAVAAYTYLCRKKTENAKEEYDITDDHTIDQAYISKEKRSEKWGDKAPVYEEKIASAVRSVSGKVITYNNELILAAYHAISPGKTETANNIWGKDLPYLQAENSVGDLLAPEYLSEAVFTVADFTERLKKLGATPTGDPQTYIGASLKSDSGTVLKINLCGKEISGTDIRTAFGLRSAAFELSFNSEKGFVFAVKGYGHGVGMSQFGANYMAQQGSTYIQIIEAYYRGAKITEKID